MKILYLSYWAAEDGLTRATVLPHLRILAEIPGVDAIVFLSIERAKRRGELIDLGERVVHVPLYSGTSYLHKIFDFVFLPKRLREVARQHAIDTCICRGAPAGSLGYLMNRGLATPYVVESFEPHAQYMVEARVWSRYGLKYFFQRKWERKQLSTAQRVITVSQNYRDYLIATGISSGRIATVPCAVDADQFAFSESRRAEIREQLGFNDECLIGIYVGKFGGLYYDNESFEIFSEAFRWFPNLRLIILTPDNVETVKDKLMREGIPTSNYYVSYASHDVVPAFLSAADFAFAPCKPSSSSKYCSPVKIGEYWASGLPVLLTKGVGDDSRIMESEGGGFTFDLGDESSLLTALQHLCALLAGSTRRELATKISQLAHRYRSFERVRTVYERILLDD